jgi:endonuclease YncB( thermonuclease family)
VIDGDTIEIHGQRIRFNGIDAPESDQLCSDVDGKKYRCGGEAAKFLQQFLQKSSPTKCDFVDWDRYGRYVGDCYRADGKGVAAAIVRAGYAVDWFKYSGGKYKSYENDAKAEKVGMWQGKFELPWEYRARMQPVRTSDSFSLFGKSSKTKCNIKGNISKRGERIYHVPGQKYYSQTVITPSKGERWFCSEWEAWFAGWRKAKI